MTISIERGCSTWPPKKDTVQASNAPQMHDLHKTGILTTNNAGYLGWDKITASFHDNLIATAKADLATFPVIWPDLEYVVLSFKY
jgi:hypothetical protein